MASPNGQQTSVPLLPSRDCSQGPCTFFCSQPCYIFPPPPPQGFPDDPSGPNLSPLVIALIGILASAFLLISYYLLISRFCGGFGSFRRRLGGEDSRADGGTEEGTAALRGDAWQAPPPAGGLEEWVIRSIAVCRYKKGDGLVEGTDCSVCLCEFRDGESLRLLPDCLHAFHVPCIDTWLKSHSNCPLCRTSIVYTFTTSSPSPPPRPPPPPLPPRAAAPPPQTTPPVSETRQNGTVAQDREMDNEVGEHGGAESRGVSMRKDPLTIRRELGVSDGRYGIIELAEEGIQPIRLDALHQSRVPAGGTLHISTEEGFPAAAAAALSSDVEVDEVGSSRGFRAEQHAYKVGGGDRVLHCVVDPATTKRSSVGGRFFLAGQLKGSHGSILPL